jgi:pyridinium-3,5-biscarboxylic acid mononucleotide synthase
MPSVDDWIERFREGKLTPVELAQKILSSSLAQDASLMLDLDRKRRCGYPEVIYGQGKSTETIKMAITRLLERENEILVTRVLPEQVRVLSEHFEYHRWNHRGGTFRAAKSEAPLDSERILAQANQAEVAVVTAGTTDESVAQESLETLAWMGVPAKLIQDVGVAGPYRLLSKVPELESVRAIVCIAGMEGALPSVLGGYVGCPVIAVPTSVGYGANFAGISALLSMLNACASNVAVVNIDSGFKGAYMAGLIARQVSVLNS